MDMDKKALQIMEREIFSMTSELKSYNQTVRNKIDELIICGRGKSEVHEIQAILTEAEEIRKAQEEVDHEDFKSSLKTEEELENLKPKIEAIKKKVRDLDKRVDEFEEKFLKYNVPRLHESESLENYAETLRAFMVIWKEEAKKGRGKGAKSLIEWLQLLEQSDSEERKSTFKAMRLVAVDLGKQISHILSEAFLFMSVSGSREEIKRNLDDFIEIIECLSVEDNSVVIDTFLNVMEFAEKAMRLRELQRAGMDHVSRRFKEKGIFHLIIKEVLRFEVALCCPDLPMMLTDEVFLAMGIYLRNVFEKKLNRIGSNMDELKMELRIYFQDEELRKVSFLIEIIGSGIKAIWKRLELKPEADDLSD